MAAATLEKYIVSSLDSLKRMKIETVVRKRQERIRQLGGFFESPSEAKAAAEATKKKETTRRTTSRSSRITNRFARTEKVTR